MEKENWRMHTTLSGDLTVKKKKICCYCKSEVKRVVLYFEGNRKIVLIHMSIWVFTLSFFFCSTVCQPFIREFAMQNHMTVKPAKLRLIERMVKIYWVLSLCQTPHRMLLDASYHFTTTQSACVGTNVLPFHMGCTDLIWKEKPFARGEE